MKPIALPGGQLPDNKQSIVTNNPSMEMSLPIIGTSNKNLAGIGPTACEQVRARACSLAALEGRAPAQVTQNDYEQAKRERSDQLALDQREAISDQMPEAALVEPATSPAGHQVRESLCEDEDAEGRSESEILTEQGVSAAEHDQIVEAARSTKRSDRCAG